MSSRNSEVQARVDRLLAEKDIRIGFSKSATQQLSTNNGSVLVNSLAHLLCNRLNHPIVDGYIDDDALPAIPMEFAEQGYGMGHLFYMCGSAPRFVGASGKHLSQDALRRLSIDDVGFRFYLWAQEWRISKYKGDVGVPQSLKEDRVPMDLREVASNIAEFKKSMAAKYDGVRK